MINFEFIEAPKKRKYNCSVIPCSIIYTNDQCKNCPDQIFDESYPSTSYT